MTTQNMVSGVLFRIIQQIKFFVGCFSKGQFISVELLSASGFHSSNFSLNLQRLTFG